MKRTSVAAERDSSAQATAPDSLSSALVAGGEGDGAASTAVGERDAGVGGRGDAAVTPGTTSKGMPASTAPRPLRRRGRRRRVAALQAHDDVALLGALDEERVDLFLIEAVASRRAPISSAGGRRVARDDLVGDEPVGDDDVGARAALRRRAA